MNHAAEITVGMAVEFDTDEGPQRGTVCGFKPDVTNGRKFALVKVPGAMGGEPWAMPVSQLARATAHA
jgi:hypothetical protein